MRGAMDLVSPILKDSYVLKFTALMACTGWRGESHYRTVKVRDQETEKGSVLRIVTRDLSVKYFI